MHFICVLKWTPPTTALYGIIISIASMVNFNTPKSQATHKIKIVFGISPNY